MLNLIRFIFKKSKTRKKHERKKMKKKMVKIFELG